MDRSINVRRQGIPLAVNWLLAPIIFLIFLGSLQAQNLSFPGLQSEAKSPDDRYVVRNSDSDREEPPHALTLIETKSGSTIQVYKYERHVDLLWSPTSNALVINDYEASDVAHPVLFTLPWSGSADLRQKLIEFLRSRGEAASALRNHHLYFTAVRWFSNGGLLCQMSGYGGVPRKTLHKQYVYTIGQGFRPYEGTRLP